MSVKEEKKYAFYLHLGYNNKCEQFYIDERQRWLQSNL